MAGPPAWLQISPQRALSGFQPDGLGNSVPLVGDSYGCLSRVGVLTGRETGLADEGSYFTTNNGQAGIAPTYGTAFSATAPFLSIYNPAPAPGPNLALTYAILTAIVAGACTTTTGYIALAAVIDSGNRYTSGGTNLTPNVVCTNGARSLAVTPTIWCGAITAGAATANARTVVGIRNIRPGVSTTVINVVGDMQYMTFGAIEGAAGNITVANANIIPIPLPPLIIPPQYTALIYLWFPVLTAPSAATFAPEIGGFIR